jgi:hypothetical protein
MTPLQRQIRACIDSFIEDVARAVQAAIKEQVSAELARFEPKPVRAPKRRATRNADGSARTERAQRGERKKRGKARQLELPLSGDAKQGSEDAGSPPPLFVHRRSRDGRILQISRVSAQGEDETTEQDGAASG